MKKFFTFAAAILFAGSMSIMADETIFLWQYDGSSVYGDGNNNGIFDVNGATTGTIKFVTYEKKKTSADGTSAYNAAVEDNDLKPAISKVCKLGNDGAHLRISPASGNFQAGDIIYICGYNNFIVSVSSDPTSTKKIAGSDATILAASIATGTAKGDCNVGEFELPSTFSETDQIYLSRVSGTSVGAAAIKVVRPADDGTPVLNVTKDSISLTATAANPSASTTVKFTGINLAPGTYDFNLPGSDSYFTVSPEYVTVDLDGKLNQEVTVTFHEATEEIIWFEEMDTEFTLTISGITKAVKLHGINDMEVNYATSLNIEQLVLDNGMGADIAAALETAHIEYANIDALDSLNDDPSKTARNYAFLGLKMKKSVDTKIGFWLAWHSTLNVRFGNVPGNVTVTINTYNSSTIAKDDIANIAVTDTKVYSFTATEGDAYIEFTSNNSKALVFKQIMIDEEIAAVVLPAKPGDETSITNTEASVKAIKRIVDGQLVTEKNGVLYNAQGAVVK